MRDGEPQWKASAYSCTESGKNGSWRGPTTLQPAIIINPLVKAVPKIHLTGRAGGKEYVKLFNTVYSDILRTPLQQGQPSADLFNKEGHSKTWPGQFARG